MYLFTSVTNNSDNLYTSIKIVLFHNLDDFDNIIIKTKYS